jgi:hypothetical protein
MQITLFCTFEQLEKLHDVTVTGYSYIFQCDCGRFVKFPVEGDLMAAIQGYKAANQGLRLVRTEADQVEVGGMTKAEVDAALERLAQLS